MYNYKTNYVTKYMILCIVYDIKASTGLSSAINDKSLYKFHH